MLAMLVAVALLALVRPAGAQDFRFSRFLVEGNQRVDAATVLSYAAIEPGRTISAGELNEAFQDILASGLFETVELEPRGALLVIRVSEWPTINRISIEGNRRIEDEDLERLLQSRPRRVYTPTIAEADAAAIVTAYETQGYFAATVDPRIIRRSENRVDLVFEITEGRVVENERVSFVGNRAFSDRRLRRVLETKQAGLLRTFFRRDSFVADRIEFDRQLLRDFYLSRGFVDFEVLSVTTELSRERNATFITFNVREGQRFRFGEITATSDLPGVDPEEYLATTKIRSGRYYTPVLVENTITRMEGLALNQGLDFVRVEPRVVRNDRALTLDIEFAITRGPRVFVERIDIEGNQTTLDRVVRRQFRVVEGDPFNPREIRNAAERIRALNFFASVDVNTREGSAPDQVIVDVDVEEQPTGTLGFGASYATDTGVGAVITFQETNFLGRGQELAFTLNTSSESGNSSISFAEPAFLGRDLRFGVSLFLNETDDNNANFDTREAGFVTSIGFPAGENSRLQLRYTLKEDELFDISTDSSTIIQSESGARVTSSIGYTYTYDTRNTGIDPNAGYVLSFGQDFAGLGGDNEYIRTTARALGQRLVMNEEVTLRAAIEGGNITMLSGGTTRVNERFFLNSRQLRGFDFRGIGPRDLTAVNQDPLGGNNYIAARFDVEFPLGFTGDLGLSGGLFYDIGTVWGLDNVAGTGGPVDDSLIWRSAVGFALYWNTPIGPLTFNFTEPIQSESYDQTRSFDVTITARF